MKGKTFQMILGKNKSPLGIIMNKYIYEEI